MTCSCWQHTDALMPLLVSIGQEEIATAAQFRALYDIDWAEEGSNRRGAEVDTIFAFELFLTGIGKSRRGIVPPCRC